MSLTRTLDILCTLQEEEWKHCGSFVYKECGASKRWALFSELKKHQHLLTDPRRIKSVLLKTTYPDQNQAAFLNTVSRLCKVIEEWLTLEELRQEELQWTRKLWLAKAYKRRGMTKHFKKTATQLLAQLEGMSDYNHDKKRKQFMTAFELAYSELSVGERMPYLISTAHDFNTYKDNMSHLIKIELGNNRKPQTGGAATVADALKSFLVDLEMINKSSNSEAANRVRDRLFSSGTNLGKEIAELSVVYLANYYSKMIKLGHAEARKQWLDIHLWGLESGVLLHNGLLSERRFINIIDVKTKIDMDQDHTSFIHHWGHKTQTEDTDQIIRLAMAFFHFGREEYHKTSEYLHSIMLKPKNLNIVLRYRWLHLCCTFELTEVHDNFEDKLNAERRYFQRNKERITKANYQSSINLINLVRLLWDYKNKRLKDIGLIKARLHKMDNVIFRLWIEKQIKKAEHQVSGPFVEIRSDKS